MTDLLLWDRGKQGDAASLDELLREAAALAHALLRRKGVPVGDRDDLVAEVQLDTLRVLRGAGTRPRNLGAFLYYRTLAVLRRYWERSGMLPRWMGPPSGEDVRERDPSDEEGVDWRDLCDLLCEQRLLDAHERCVEGMPREVQRVYRLLVDEHLSQAEIARRLGQNQVWVHRRVGEARTRILEELRRLGYLSGG